ncbi:MAG: DUF1015 domain-containing protein [Clostridiales bacterium]|nr:DUF1015 domain-containing protein [Clostridiales bacterium]
MWGDFVRPINDLGFAVPEILLPKQGTDLKKWAVIACDQYTSEPEYWANASKEAGDAPSTLNLVLPEVYLGTDKEAEKLGSIADTARKYLDEGILQSLGAGFILTDRATELHPSRRGLMAAIDLEGYSFEPGNKNICRATEGTVLSRIPPRVRIRANSPLELPHIMVLIDDPEGLTIEKAFEMADAEGLKPLYDTDLMLGSGHIKGTFVADGTPIAESIVNGLKTLKSRNADGLLFLVGDGNHSLASAKAHWENIRANLSEEEKKTHPARYALAEIVNIHDKGLDFEPIHRVVFNISAEDFIAKAKEYFKDNGIEINSASDDKQSFVVVTEGSEDVKISLGNPPHTLAIGSVQMMIDSLKLECDYIHGEDSVRKLATAGNTGILVPGISKDTFFGTVEKEGVFPRKTFSMGEAFEKRFYLEAKIIE